MFKYILFDVDDTLLDFGKCAEFAMRSAFDDFGFYFEHGMFEVFTEINNGLWLKVESGEISKDSLFGSRWFTVFEKLDLVGDGNRFEDRFQKYLNVSSFKIEGADDILDYLSSKFKIFVASNAPSGQQQKRLTFAGLAGFISGYFVSGDFGVSKPSEEFFAKCLDSIPASAEECIMVGDSLTSDIAGAQSCGINACWFNLKGKTAHDGISPDYIITSLCDLKNIL